MRPAERTRWRTSNQGWAICTPSALASLLRAMQAPSLEDRTTTGRPARRGAKTRSQLTYMLLAATRANTGFRRPQTARGRSCEQHADNRGDDAPDFQGSVLADHDVGLSAARRLQAAGTGLLPQPPAHELALVDSDDDVAV